jgi:hypothetical protein
MVQVDYSLIRELLKYICESGYEQGAILVFLPGCVRLPYATINLSLPQPVCLACGGDILSDTPDQDRCSLIPACFVLWCVDAGGTTSRGCVT